MVKSHFGGLPNNLTTGLQDYRTTGLQDYRTADLNLGSTAWWPQGGRRIYLGYFNLQILPLGNVRLFRRIRKHDTLFLKMRFFVNI